MSFELCLKCQHNRIWITNSPTGKCEHGRDQDDPCGCNCKEWTMFVPELTASQAGEIEVEIQRLESDPTVSKRALRLFMQSSMPCGHAVGNLLTCPDPPFGCVVCGVIESSETDDFNHHLGRASATVRGWPKWKQNILG